MNRCAKAAGSLLGLMIPVIACSVAFADEGSIKTVTRFLPKSQSPGRVVEQPESDEPLVDIGVSGVPTPGAPGMAEPESTGEAQAEDDLGPVQLPPASGGIPETEELQSMSKVLRVWVATDEPNPQSPSLTVEDEEPSTAPSSPTFVVESPESVLAPGAPGHPLSGTQPAGWDPLKYLNAAIPRILSEVETSGWYSGLKADVQTLSAQLKRYVRGRTVGGQNAGTIVDALDALRAAAKDLREVAKDEKAIAELYAKAQPNNPDACPSTNRGCQAIRRIANVLKNWEAIRGASSNPETTSDLQTRLSGIFTDFFTRAEASSRWVYDQARGLEEICDRIVSTTKPVDGTSVGFSDWRNKLNLVEENLHWALDHADDPKNLSAVVFGLEMAKEFKEDLEKMHEKK